jgi:hypothetical protein
LERFGSHTPTMGAHVRSIRSIFDAFRGQRERAIEGAAAAVAAEPVSADAYNNTQLLANQAFVHMILGDKARAVRFLEYLLAIPSQISIPALRTDPSWNRLRGYPPFERLITGERVQQGPPRT